MSNFGAIRPWVTFVVPQTNPISVVELLDSTGLGRNKGCNLGGANSQEVALENSTSEW